MIAMTSTDTQSELLGLRPVLFADTVLSFFKDEEKATDY